MVIAKGLGEIETGVEGESAAVALFERDISTVPGVVIEIGEQVYGSELRVDHIVLLGLKNSILQSAVSAKRDRQGNAVDVPTALQTHAGRTLVLDVDEPGGAGLILEARRPVHDIGVMEIGISPSGVTAAKVRAGIGDRAIGIHHVFDGPRSIL